MKTSIKTIILAAFLPLIMAGAGNAFANGVNQTTENGDSQTGTVTGSGIDQLNYGSTAGRWLHMGTSTSNTYYCLVQIFRPTGVLQQQGTGQYGAWADAPGSATSSYTGTWAGKNSNYNATSSGSYSTSINESVTQTSLAGPRKGGDMIPGVTLSGSVSGGSFDVYTFQGVSGGTIRVDVTGGGGSKYMDMFVINPAGAIPVGGSDATAGTDYTTFSSATGTYTLYVEKYFDDSNSVSYTVAVSGTGVAQPTTPKPAGTLASNPGAASIAEPINIATGNVFDSITDYTTVGTNPLAFIRTYNSQSYTFNAYPSALGPNWRHNFDRYIRDISSTQATAEREDGRVINFTLVSSVWTPDADVDYTLTKSGTTWTLTGPDDVVETYTESSGKGTLNSIAWPNGYTQTLTYTSGKLTSVSDSYSRTLTLSYTGSDLTGVATPDSATLTYGYTSTAGQDLLTSITYNTSPSTSQTYVYGVSKLPFMLTSITDENGNTNFQWTYDGAGRATMSEGAGGANEYQISYNDSNGNRTVTGPLGNAETYSFTSDHNVNKVSSIARATNSPVAAATENFTYDSNGYLATATDWNGNSTHYTNNSHGLPTSITEAYGAGIARTTSITYDSTWVHKPYTTTKANVTIDNRYDSSTGNLLTHELTDTTGGTTNGQTRTWTYTYNATGEMLTAQMPRTGTTVKNTYTYTAGALTSITDQLSHSVTISTYQGGGLPTKILDANSVETDLVYNNRNWLTSKTVKATPSNEVTSYTYIASGQPYVTTLPDSSTFTYTYDNAQRLTKIANTAGETINYTLNADGESTTTTLKDSGGTTRKSFTATYDVLGDRLTLVGSAGATQTTTYTWDGNRNRTSVEDANSKTTSLAWDALNRPSTITDALSHTAAPTYDNLDNITAQTDFNGYSTAYTFDGFHDVIKRVSPDTGTITNTFDEDHNLTGRTDARSVVSAQTFDAADRITATTFTGYSGENIAYTYDSTSGGNVGVGRLTSVTDESGSTTITYDNFGNILKEVRVIGSQTYTTSYSYDLANRLTEIIYPSGRYVDYTYDSSGYLTTVTTKPSSGGTVTTLASSIAHKPFGPISGLTLGNTLTQTNTWDNNYWLDDIVTSNGSTHIQNLTFAQDYAGNMTSITDNLDASRDETYTVDSLNRLHTASGAYGSRTYTYDNNGNRSTWYNGTITRTSTLTTSTNLLASITDGTNTRHFTNSGSGNVLTDDRVMNGGVAISNTYGGRDRLESMTVGTPTITFKINAFGQRVQKATTSLTTDYQLDLAGHIIGENDDSTGNDLTEYIWMEGKVLAQIDSSGNIYYVHNSQVGAPQKITDSSMNIVWDYEIEPFGEPYATPTNTDPTNIRFPGQYFDVENLLNYNGYRNQDVSTGRYNEADPTGFGGGLNLFGYAGQNPVQTIDPSGLLQYSTAAYVYDSNGAPKVNSDLTHFVGTSMYQVSVMGDDGTPINVYTPQAPANLYTVTKATAGQTTNCLGATLANGQYWVDGPGASQILQHDYYSPVPSTVTAKGDIAILSASVSVDPNNGRPIPIDIFHGATVDSNEGGVVTLTTSKNGDQPVVNNPPALSLDQTTFNTQPARLRSPDGVSIGPYEPTYWVYTPHP